jgi:hypothetical protein
MVVHGRSRKNPRRAVVVSVSRSKLLSGPNLYPRASDSGLLLDSKWRVETAALAGSKITLENAALWANLGEPLVFVGFSGSDADFGALCSYSVAGRKQAPQTIAALSPARRLICLRAGVTATTSPGLFPVCVTYRKASVISLKCSRMREFNHAVTSMALLLKGSAATQSGF